MNIKEKALKIIEALKKEYPDAICSLVYPDPLQLLIATRLAAQCTDAGEHDNTGSFEKYRHLKIL